MVEISLELLVLDGSRVVSVNYLEEWVDELSLNRDLELGNHVSDLIDGQSLGATEVEVVVDFTVEVWVVSSELVDSGLDLGIEMSDNSLGLLLILVLWNLPGGLHHSDEVLFTRGTHGEITVVVVELLPFNDTILVTSVTFKVLEEGVEDLVLSFSSLKEIWVHGNIINVFDV